MQIYGTSQVHGTQAINAPHAAREASPSTSVGGSSLITDQLDISPAGQLADQLSQIPDIRADKVAQLRASIASGTYETPDKLSTALDNLLSEIA